MATRFLTYTFYSFLTNPEALISGEPLRYKTYMPLTYHPIYNLPYNLSYDDALDILLSEGYSSDVAIGLLEDENGYFRPDQNDKNIWGYLNASPDLYNGTVSLNGQSKGILPKGITFQFDSDSVTAIIDTSSDAFGQIAEGTRVEISLQYAQTEAMWIYYGTNRYDLATRLGREPTGMGGVQPSMTPADAIQMNYRIDNDVTPVNQFSVVLPFVPSLYSPITSSSSAQKEVIMMLDVLDGRLNSDGSERVAIRTSTRFDVYSLSLNTSLFSGFLTETALQTEFGTESYRNIHSKTLEYQESSYQEEKVIKNKTFIIICNAKYDLDDFYLKLSESIKYNTYKFIDFKTCKFSIWSLSQGEEGSIPIHIGTTTYQDFDSEDYEPQQKEDLSGYFSFLSPGSGSSEEVTYTPSFKDSYLKCEDIIKIQFTSDMNDYLSYGDAPTIPDPRTISYDFEFLSDMNFEYIENEAGDDFYSPKREESLTSIDLFPSTIEVVIGDESYSTSNISLSGCACIGRGKENIRVIDLSTQNSVTYQSILEKNSDYIFEDAFSFTMIESGGFDSFVIQFLNLLSRDVTIDIENEMLSQSINSSGDPFVDTDIISRQCEDLLREVSYISQDINGDGKATLVDHITSLYTKGFTVEDNSSEIRYWRKMCPIGQMYKVSGTIGGGINVYNGDYFFTVNVDGDVDKKIWVYLERGARTNVSNANVGDTFELQGRLFYPEYFRDINLDYYMDFRETDGIKAWYRLRENTIDFLYNGIQSTSIEESGGKPILIIRSNDELVPNEEGDSDLPSVFNGVDDSTYLYGASRQPFAEQIGDYFFDKTLEFDPFENYDEDFVQLGRGDAFTVFSIDGEDVELKTLKIKMEVLDDNPDYQYEIWYNNVNSDGLFKLWKFHSRYADLSEEGTLTFNLSGYYKMPCELGEEDDNKTLYLKYSYSKQQTGIDGEDIVNYVFTWEENIFDVVSVWKNGNKIGSGLSGDGYVITPSEGKIVFDDTIDPKYELIEIELVNVSDLNSEQILAKDYNPTKFGNHLEIRRIEDGITPGESGSPKISDVSINAGRSDSVERVECVFSHTSRGTSAHYIAPAYGFDYLAGDGSWFMTTDTGARILAGDLRTPYFYIDKALKSSDQRKYIDKSNETLVSIDRIYGNAASVVQPTVYVRLNYTEPVIDTVDTISRTCVHHSKVTEKTTLVYVDNNILNQKYSYVDFAGRNDVYESGSQEGQMKYEFFDTGETYYRENLRRSNPVRSWEIVYPQYPLFESSDEYGSEEAVFNIISSLGELAVIGVVSTEHINENFVNTEPFELYGSSSSSGGDESFYPIGYESFSGDKTSLMFGATNSRYDEGYAKSFVVLPDMRNIQRIKIKKPTNENGVLKSSVGNVLNVIGGYTRRYTKGNNPHLQESPDGTMLLFYLDENNENIMLYSSRNRGDDWNRPMVDPDAEKDGYPIPIYQKETKIGGLTGFEDRINNISNLFFYDYGDLSIGCLSFSSAMATRIYEGIGESATEVSSQDDDSIGYDTSKIKSWEEFLKIENSVRRVLNTSVELFSVTQDDGGTLWLFYVSPSGAINIIYSERLRSVGEEEGSDWKISGLDILSDESNLYKCIGDQKISSITVSYNSVDDLFYLFLTTSKNHLILLTISQSCLSYYDKGAKEEIIEKIQKNSINNLIPILVIGDKNLYSEVSDFIILENPLLDKFTKVPPQNFSVSWSNSGVCNLFYYDENGKIKAIKSENVKYWRENKNV